MYSIAVGEHEAVELTAVVVHYADAREVHVEPRSAAGPVLLRVDLDDPADVAVDDAAVVVVLRLPHAVAAAEDPLALFPTVLDLRKVAAGGGPRPAGHPRARG